MSRRIVPGTFWTGILASALLLLLAGTMRASSPSEGLPNLRGIWDGIFLASDGVTTGDVRSDITRQESGRLVGHGVLIGLTDDDVRYRFHATLERPDFLTGTGETPGGRLVFQSDVATFAGHKGAAGVMAAEYGFVTPRGGASRISALLLHPFPGGGTPDISGSGLGSFVSLPDPTMPNSVPDPAFKGVGKVQISQRDDRDSFAGHVEFFLDPNQPPVLSWPVLATASENGRVIMISQGKTGRIVYDGVVVPGRHARAPTFVGGFFRLLFNSGQNVYGAYNFSVIQ